MKALWISLASLAIVLTVWLVFMHVAEETLHEMATVIERETYPLSVKGSWDDASRSFEKVSETWKKHKRAYILFSNSAAVAEAEYSFHRTRAYLEAQDKGALCGELSYLRRQLLFLHEYEIMSLENII